MTRRITLKNISKTFGNREDKTAPVTAIKDISLTIEAGEAIAILGPSGCGKTTLLRLIAGLEEPDSGTVWYDDARLESIPVEHRGIGMVFQNYVLIPHWESRRTIGFFLKLRDREQEVPARVDEVSRITGVGIQDLMGKFPKHLSGGEKQRVAIARAFARDLELLLFDEPFANLDAKFRGTARVELKRLIQKFDATMVYVTHDQIEAISVAERIIVMNAGRIIQMGSYEHLHDEPDNLFVAEFIGTPTINSFWGKIVNGMWDGSYMGQFPLPSPVKEGTEVILAIRPEYMRFTEGGIPSVIDTIIPFYAENYQILEVWLRKRRWQILAPLEDSFEVGQTIYCEIDLDHAYFFDAETGQRIR